MVSGEVHEVSLYVTMLPPLYPGRHTPLISDELFNQVQELLKAHRHSGERERKHHHYLKGTLRCRHCDHRLTYSRNKGNGGTYEYFVCLCHQKGQCPQRTQRVEAVEAAVEDHYRSIDFTPTDRDRVRAAIEHHLGRMAATSNQELQRCQGVLSSLKQQEKKLLAKHYQDDISDELFHEEAERIKHERKDTQTIINRLSLRHDELTTGLAVALKLISSDLHDLYLRANPTVRRLMNQAIFEVIWIWDETEVHANLASPFKELIIAKDTTRAAKRRRPSRQPQPTATADSLPGWGARWGQEDDEAPDTWEASEASVVGLSNEVMVGPAGLEPATYRL
jgi:site-specific DNA recombinase